MASHPEVWSADDHVPWTHAQYEYRGLCSFYPLYLQGRKRSFSPLALARHRGCIVVNRSCLKRLDDWSRPYRPPGWLIDRDIVRLGSAWAFQATIKDPDDLVARLAAALREDVAAVERANDWVHVVLVGGKDSLNLLLLPWRNPVFVASAEPNYPLVRRFVADHDLDFPCIRLQDDLELDLQREILTNFARLDLAHCRWGGHLSAIARHNENNVVFWTGQLGGALLTPRWRNYGITRNRYPGMRGQFKKRVEALGTRISSQPFLRISRHHEERFQTALWARGAQWQGTHLGFLHELTGSPFLSGYHGPAVSRVLSQTSHRHAVRHDLRARLGQTIADRPVRYPSENPSPPLSQCRRGVSSASTFLSAAVDAGLTLC